MEMRLINQGNQNSTSAKLKRSCVCITLIFIVAGFPLLCILTGLRINSVVIEEVNWNSRAKESHANITLHYVYKNRKDESAIIYGQIYVDFPESGSMFDICNEKDQSDSIETCKTYLESHYPVGKSVKIYYNPNDVFDITLDKLNLTKDIALTTATLVLIFLYFLNMLWMTKIAIRYYFPVRPLIPNE